MLVWPRTSSTSSQAEITGSAEVEPLRILTPLDDYGYATGVDPSGRATGTEARPIGF
jgi:hypothetical protein